MTDETKEMPAVSEFDADGVFRELRYRAYTETKKPFEHNGLYLIALVLEGSYERKQMCGVLLAKESLGELIEGLQRIHQMME